MFLMCHFVRGSMVLGTVVWVLESMAELVVEMDKKEYLKKYLSGDTKTEKKKKKLKVKNSRKTQSRFKIVDEDIDIKSLETAKDTEDEEIGDEAPAVAEIIDERPQDIKLNELYKSTQWKKLEETITEIKQEEPEHQQTLASDFVMQPEEVNNLDIKTRHDSSSDLSPPRQIKCFLGQSDSDLSPPRQRMDNDSYQRIEHTTRSNLSNIRQVPTSKNYNDSDSDLSPPRQNRMESNSGKISKDELTSTHLSPKKTLKYSIKTRCNSDNEVSPHRQKHRTSMKVAYDSNNNKSPEMKVRYAQSRTKHKKSVREKSPSIIDKYDSDHSPLRVRRKTSTEKSKHKSNKYATVKNHEPQKMTKKYFNSDCNFSPVRKHSKHDIAFQRYKSVANNDSFSLNDSCREIYTEKEMNKQYSKIDNSPSPSRHYSSSRLPDTHFGRKSESYIIKMPKVEKYEEEVNSLGKRHQMYDIHKKNKNIVKLCSSEKKKCKDSIDEPKRQYSNIKKARYDSDSDLSSPHCSQDFKEYRSTESKYAPQQRKVEHKVPKIRYPSERNRYQTSGSISESNSSSSEPDPKRLKTRDKPRKHIEPGMESSQKDFKSSRPTCTLSGMKAGLQDASLRSLKEETSDMRKRELNKLNEMGDDLSGRTAETVVRDRATGLKRDLKEERLKQKDDEDKNAKQQEKYMEWGKGLKQKEQQKNRLNEDIYEMSKPLARYRDDEDLERQLKETERQGDPMLDYIRKKKKKNEPVTASLPAYSGPPAPPNRFGINPGYRWDGVDRSNGFERKLFESKSKKKAQEEEAYSWSVQNM